MFALQNNEEVNAKITKFNGESKVILSDLITESEFENDLKFQLISSVRIALKNQPFSKAENFRKISGIYAVVWITIVKVNAVDNSKGLETNLNIIGKITKVNNFTEFEMKLRGFSFLVMETKFLTKEGRFADFESKMERIPRQRPGNVASGRRIDLTINLVRNTFLSA